MSRPLTEDTGREIARQLRRIADALEPKPAESKDVEIRFDGITVTEDDIRRSVEEATSRDEARGLIGTL